MLLERAMRVTIRDKQPSPYSGVYESQQLQEWQDTLKGAIVAQTPRGQPTAK